MLILLNVSNRDSTSTSIKCVTILLLASNFILFITTVLNMISPSPDDSTDVANRRVFAWVSTTLILVLSICSYAIRLWARRLSRQPLKVDDYLMGVGLLLSFIPAVSEYVCKNYQSPFITEVWFLSACKWPRASCLECISEGEISFHQSKSHAYKTKLR